MALKDKGRQPTESVKKKGKSASAKSTKRAAAPKKKRTATRKAGALAKSGVSLEQRLHMIAEAAYLRAAARGFQGGDPTADWLEAERQIDRMLGREAA